MNSLIYAGVVVAGAITLLIEAYRNFNSSLTTIPFKEHPILKDVEVAQLCTSREKNIGFMFYSLLYLATYIIILSSSEIYDLVSQAAKSNAEIGPTDTLVGQGKDPFGLLNTQYGKPIFISAAIIAIFSLGALRPIESTMRTLAHRIAGVPRGVYNVIEDLHAIEFDNFKNKCATPLTNMFEANAEGRFKGSYEADQIGTIKTALRTVDYLSPAITGKLRIQYFPFTQLDAMSELSAKLEAQLDNLRATLKVELPPEEAERAKLFNASMAAANDTIALFAVHFLRNNRAIKNFKDKTAIAEVYKKIQQDYQIELNSFAMSLFVSFFLAVGVGTALVTNWNYTKKNFHRHEVIAGHVREGLLTLENWEVADIDACVASPPERPFFWVHWENPVSGVPLTELSPAKMVDCENLWKQLARGRFFEVLQGSLNQTFWNMVAVALAVGLPAVSALFGRDVRREDNSWPEWTFRRIPFIRLASMAAVPAVLSVLGITLGSFLKIWFDSGLDLTENQIKFFFESSYVFFLMHAFIGFIVAIGVLVLIDQHDFLFSEVSWFVGALIGFAALLFYYVIILVGYGPGFVQARHQGAWFSYEVREMLVYGTMPFLFLFFFAVFLELTEERTRHTGSLFLRPFHRAKAAKGEVE